MERDPLARARHRLPRARVPTILVRASVACALAVCVWGCEQKPSVPLHQGTVSNADLSPSTPEPAPLVDESALLARGWFEDSRGQAALKARRRGDAEVSETLLSAVLADAGKGTSDGAGASLLLGIWRLEARDFEGARAHFEVASQAPSLAPIAGRVRLWQAEVALGGDQPGSARGLLEAAEVDATLAPTRAWLEVRAAERAGSPDEAAAALSDFLERFPEADERYEARALLGAHLLARDPARARDLLEGVVLAVPLSTFAGRAREGLTTLERSKATRTSAAARREFARAEAVARLEAQLSRRRYAAVIKAARPLLEDKRLSMQQRCVVSYARARARFRQRKRAEARPWFDGAGRACEASKDWDRVVKSRYQSARGRYAAGEYDRAGEAFEALAAAFPQHSYADDALLLAGESWTSAGQPDRAEAAWRRALAEHPSGDMREEQQRRLMIAAFDAGAPERVLSLVEGALVEATPGDPASAKLRYFEGRALAQLGRMDASRTAYLEAVRLAPISYPSLQALSRLSELGPEALAEGLALLERQDAAAVRASDVVDVPRAAQIFARLGLGEETSRVLDAAGVGGWQKATLLTQAGLYRSAQRTVHAMRSGWRAVPPGPSNAARWAVAHPRPFREVVEPREARLAIAPFLAYAVMQTESRFDPGAVSWAGARGLVQLMPATAKDLAQRAGIELSSGDVHDPEINLELGMRYLARLTARFGGGPGAEALAVPSYNAGAGAVDRWLTARGEQDLDLFIEAIPYDETRKYVQAVLGRWMAYRWLYAEGPASDRVPLLPLKTPSRDAD